MSAPDKLVFGTRGSALALAQSRSFARALMARHDGLVVEERILKTEGDIRADVQLGPDDRGVFVKAIERALLEGQVDFAVHSLKDLPSTDTPGLTLAAIPEREDPRDVLVSRTGADLDSLPRGSSVGTGSPRRRSQLLYARPDLDLRPIRGNIDTRLGRVDKDLDSVVLAAAGLNRLAVDRQRSAIDPDTCLPAVGQGALAIQARDGEAATVECLRLLDHPSTRFQVAAERAFLAELGGGCLAPATAFARPDGSGLRIDAMVGEIDGADRLVESCRCTLEEAPERARELARTLIGRGARAWIEAARERAQGDG